MSDDSSDEDVPLGQLLAGKKSASPAQKIVAPKKKQDKSAEGAPVAKKNKVTPAKKVKAESKSAKPDPKPAPRAKSGTVKNDCDLFYDTVKGQLVQKLECRCVFPPILDRLKCFPSHSCRFQMVVRDSVALERKS